MALLKFSVTYMHTYTFAHILMAHILSITLKVSQQRSSILNILFRTVSVNGDKLLLAYLFCVCLEPKTFAAK